MKKIMSLMLGLALLTGAATVAFSQSTDTDKETKKSKKGKKGTDTEGGKKSDKR